jgi:hypothetical protein
VVARITERCAEVKIKVPDVGQAIDGVRSGLVTISDGQDFTVG